MPTDVPPFEASFDERDFLDLPLSELHSSVMPLFFFGPEATIGLGTAFTISSLGLMLTARHVIEDAIQLLEESPEGYVAVVYITSGEGREVPDLFGGRLRVSRVARSMTTDMALLELELPIIAGERLVLPALQLSPGYPTPGEVMALGYNRLEGGVTDKMTPGAIELQSRLKASRGTITQVHGEKRDTVMLPFPCFEMSVRTDPGMSGGPIIAASNGRVCGVVCTGLHADDEAFTSWGSVLAPAFALSFSEEDAGSDTESLLALARRGFLSVDSSVEGISLWQNADGTQTMQVKRPKQTEAG